jgi:hypothetical protein
MLGLTIVLAGQAISILASSMTSWRRQHESQGFTQ